MPSAKPVPTLAAPAVLGTWHIIATPPDGVPLEITSFRGMPVGIDSFDFTDPFGPKSAQLTLPQVSPLERMGEHDLGFLADGTDIDIYWDGPLPSDYLWGSQFLWSGFISGFGEQSSGTTRQVTAECTGAMLQIDDVLAKPSYPFQPIPYEQMFIEAFDPALRPELRLKKLVIDWPSWWAVKYNPPASSPWYLLPLGLAKTQLWTGLVTRSTGNWDPMLSGYLQELLLNLYTPRGRFTLDLIGNREPHLLHRDMIAAPANDTVLIDPADPGVSFNLNQDFSQRANVIYGQSVALSGEAYTGAIYSGDGDIVGYKPLAYRRQVHPVTDANGWLDAGVMRKELNLQLPQGLNGDQAMAIGTAHLARFTEPGRTGTITLSSDPLRSDGTRISRFLVRAGMSVQLLRVGGRKDGVLAHVVSNQVSLVNQTNELTIDTKWRDYTTVEEVKAKGRDSMQVARQLAVPSGGSFTPAVPDSIVPWNYREGSGYIPSGGGFTAHPLLRDMPDGIDFPWQSWIQGRPPSDPGWEHCYMHLGPVDLNNADNNWAFTTVQGTPGRCYPIKMAQAGTIQAIEIAAFDANGNIKPVSFCFVLVSVNSVSAQSMPAIDDANTDTTGHASAINSANAARGVNSNYVSGQHYPFFASAFEAFNPDGTRIDPQIPAVAVEANGLVRVWGTYYERAGYWPGTSLNPSQAKTGMLRDETHWQFDTTTESGEFIINQQFPPSKQSNRAGYLFASIYCDEQGSSDVYFVGRMFVLPPSSSAVGGY